MAEFWKSDAGDADVARLNIPPTLLRERRFDIDVRFEVNSPVSNTSAWHELTVEVNGRREWRRRISTGNPGHMDSLDYHFRIESPAGTGVQVRAITTVRGAQRRRLLIEAIES